MKAHLNSARIAPKKANLIAKMVRGMPVGKAMIALQHTHKKGARMIEQLLKSAIANAEHNDKQDGTVLVIKTLVVNQGTSYRRAIPKARGAVRPIQKFLSHISLTLGIAEEKMEKAKKSEKAPSQTAKKSVKSLKTSSSKKKTEEAISPDSSSSTPA